MHKNAYDHMYCMYMHYLIFCALYVHFYVSIFVFGAVAKRDYRKFVRTLSKQVWGCGLEMIWL